MQSHYTTKREIAQPLGKSKKMIAIKSLYEQKMCYKKPERFSWEKNDKLLKAYQLKEAIPFWKLFFSYAKKKMRATVSYTSRLRAAKKSDFSAYFLCVGKMDIMLQHRNPSLTLAVIFANLAI